jgi:type IV secretion system protein VirB3
MSESDEARTTIHQSLTKPLLLAGAERAPAAANWIFATGILFGGGLHWYTIAVSAFMLTMGHWALVQAAKFDPHLTRVYMRHIRYQHSYLERSTPIALIPLVRPSVPTTRQLQW